jgi:hypothetical protein
MKPFEQQTYYELLEIPVTAPDEEIRAAYERALETYSPDSVAVYALVDPGQIDALRARLTEAMEILTEPDLRAEYDQMIGVKREPTAVMAKTITEAPSASGSTAPVASARNEAAAQAANEAPAASAPVATPVTAEAPASSSASVVAAAPEPVPAREPSVAPAPQPAEPAAIQATAPVPSPAAPVVSPPPAEPAAQSPAVAAPVASAPAAEPAPAPSAPVEESPRSAPTQASPQPAASASAPASAATQAQAQDDDDEVSGAHPPPPALRPDIQPNAPGLPIARSLRPTPTPPPLPGLRRPTRSSPSVSHSAPSAESAKAPASSRSLGEADQLAQESAIATAEAALAQVAAKAREPRPKPIELPPDTEFNGELLRRVRESRGLSLPQLAERTRISSKHIENVEADRYSALPATVYLRGMLMSLARELNLDPLRVSKSYLALTTAPKKK